MKKAALSDCFFSWRRARDSKSGKRVKKRVKKCKKALFYCILSFELFFLKTQDKNNKNNKNRILNKKTGCGSSFFSPLSAMIFGLHFFKEDICAVIEQTIKAKVAKSPLQLCKR